MGRTTIARKQRKTYTLSTEAIAILDTEKKDRHAQSTSAVLETLLKEVRDRRKLARMSASISSYYDSLSQEDKKDQQLWGAFSETQFPLE